MSRCSIFQKHTTRLGSIESGTSTTTGGDTRKGEIDIRSGSWRVDAQGAEFGDDPFDLNVIGRLAIIRREYPQTNPVLAAGAMEERFLVNPADTFVGKGIDPEHVERVTGAAPGIFQRWYAKF